MTGDIAAATSRMAARLLVGRTRYARMRDLLQGVQRRHKIIRRVNIRGLLNVRLTFDGGLSVGNVTVRQGKAR